MRAGAETEGDEDEGCQDGQILVNGAGGNHTGQSNADRMTTKSLPVQIFYKPAYELEDETAERLGRDW